MSHERIIIAFGTALVLGCTSQDLKKPTSKYTPSTEFRSSTTIMKEQDKFTSASICKLVHSVGMYIYGIYHQEVNRTELVVILNETSPQWLGVIQEHDRKRVQGGGHFLAGTINGLYIDAGLALKNGITEPFSINFQNSFPTAVIRTTDILSWHQSGATEVKLRREYDNVVATIDMAKVADFVEQCL